VRVAMIGVGSGACMADLGHTVVCVDKDSAKIADLKRGELSIHEPGLQDLVHTNLRGARLTFTTSLEEPLRAERQCRSLLRL
jgi:UDPglucose 6-dehydrogenase